TNEEVIVVVCGIGKLGVVDVIFRTQVQCDSGESESANAKFVLVVEVAASRMEVCSITKVTYGVTLIVGEAYRSAGSQNS
ncbi:hypothetical protein AKJ16_DCAP16983, partial [Drosera capensis]